MVASIIATHVFSCAHSVDYIFLFLAVCEPEPPEDFPQFTSRVINFDPYYVSPFTVFVGARFTLLFCSLNLLVRLR